MGYMGYLEHPSKQQFYKYLALYSGILGLNTESWHWYRRPTSKWYDVQRFVVIIFVPIGVISETLYVCIHFKDNDFAALAGMFCILAIAWVVMLKSALAQTDSYKVAMNNFMRRMHLHNFIHDDMNKARYKFVTRELIGAEKSSRWTFTILFSCVMICCCAWNIVPIIHNFKNNSSIKNITTRLEVCVHYWQPFDYEYNFYTYLFMQILGGYGGGVAVIVMVLFDTINFACIFHLVGHIKILKNDLEFSFKGKMTEDIKRQKLVNIAKHYYFITRSFKEVEKAFEYSVLGIYLQNLIQGGLLLYQILSSDMDTETLSTYGLMITIITGILTGMSIVLENIRIQSEDIPMLVYNLPWESMSIPNQKMVLVILCQVQPTLEFKAAFNTKTGIQPAINILKTAFSYYVMINQAREMKK